MVAVAVFLEVWFGMIEASITLNPVSPWMGSTTASISGRAHSRRTYR